MNSPIKFRVLCTCGKPLEVSRANVGKTGRCPTCKAMFVIPQPPEGAGQGGKGSTAGQGKSTPGELEIDLELDLPETAPVSPTDNAASTGRRKRGKATASLEMPPFSAPVGSGFGGAESNLTPPLRSEVRYQAGVQPQGGYRTKSSNSGTLFLTLGILAGVFLLGGLVFGTVLFVKSYVASMPQVVPTQVNGTEISQAEAMDAGDKWIQQAFSSTFVATDSASTFDEKLLYSLALEKVALSPKVRSEAISKMESISNSVCSLATKDFDSATVLQATKDTSAPIVSVRLFNGSTGELTYLLAKCRRSEDLKVRVCDIDLLDGKGWASELLKRNLISIPQARQAILDTYAPADGYAEDAMVDRLGTICGLPAADPSKRSSIYKELLPAYANHPTIERIYVMSCADEGNVNGFRNAYSSFRSNHPNDCSITNFAMRYLPSHGVFDLLDADIDILEKTVGGDPYLDWYKALSSAVNNRFDDAKKMFQLLSEKPWAPDSAKSLLAFANNPKSPRPQARLPLVGTAIATNKNLFMKPRTQAEIERELAESYGDSQQAEEAEAQRKRNVMLAQEEAAMSEYSKTQQSGAEADKAFQRSSEEAQRAADEYSASQQTMQQQGPPPGYDPGGVYGPDYNPNAPRNPQKGTGKKPKVYTPKGPGFNSKGLPVPQIDGTSRP